MNLYKTLSPVGHGIHIPHTTTIHAMGQFIKCDSWTAKEFNKRGVDLVAGQIYHARDWLTKIGLGAHFIVDGQTVFQCKELAQRIWHSRGFNTGYIGIEVLVPGVFTNTEELYNVINNENWVSSPLYKATLDTVIYVNQRCKRINHLTTHSAIDNRVDGRGVKVKQDPGQMFPFEKLLRESGIR